MEHLLHTFADIKMMDPPFPTAGDIHPSLSTSSFRGRRVEKTEAPSAGFNARDRELQRLIHWSHCSRPALKQSGSDNVPTAGGPGTCRGGWHEK